MPYKISTFRISYIHYHTTWGQINTFRTCYRTSKSGSGTTSPQNDTGGKNKKPLRMFYKWSTTSGSDTTTTTQPGHGKDPTYLGYAMMLGLSTTLNKLHDKRNNEYIEDMLPKFPSDVKTRHYHC